MKRATVTISIALLVFLSGCAAFPGIGNTTTETDGTGPILVDDEVLDPPGDSPSDSPSSPNASGELQLHHIDVGQADATLITTPTGETILIDTGDWRDGGDDVIAYLEKHDIDRIDHLVATHAHADHIGGHDAVIEWAETNGGGIGAAYDSGEPHTTQTYDRYLDAVETHNVSLYTVESGDELSLEGNTTATVLNPPVEDTGNGLHDNSIALLIEFGEFSYITTGDAEQPAEQRIVDTHGDEIRSDVYHAGHHGSSTSSTPVFLDAVNPDIAIISSAYDSQYGHPHDDVLTAFSDRDIDTYWTGVHGDIVLTVDANATVTVDTHADHSTDPSELRRDTHRNTTTMSTPTTPTSTHTPPLAHTARV